MSNLRKKFTLTAELGFEAFGSDGRQITTEVLARIKSAMQQAVYQASVTATFSDVTRNFQLKVGELK
jgi:hypothetical protein